ncbi:hypothetical protein OG871_28925 [Kitasatospora sp. NBC_00374]|uniref:hypothetical protein n=1 Tax=Kitasatospora sp. NBC_00374 TaxID=2975964 RepID=UPI0030DE3B8E
MTDTATAGLVQLILTAVAVLAPLGGAIVAAVFIRRRGLNARLAMAGCLVMLPGPMVVTVGSVVGLEPLVDAFGPATAYSMLSAVTVPFHLIGLGLVLAGALVAPAAERLPAPEAIRVGDPEAGWHEDAGAAV